jgi:WD40 repeat protein
MTYQTELIASGDASGKIKVWRLRTGSCIRKFLSAHSKGVTCSQPQYQYLSISTDRYMLLTSFTYLSVSYYHHFMIGSTGVCS